MKLIKKDVVDGGVRDMFYVYETNEGNYDIVMLVPEMELIVNEKY